MANSQVKKLTSDIFSKDLEGCIHDDLERQNVCFLCEKKICSVCAIRNILFHHNKLSISKYYCPFCFFLMERQNFLPPKRPNVINFFSWILPNGKKDNIVSLLLFVTYFISLSGLLYNPGTITSYLFPVAIVFQLTYYYTTFNGRKRPLDNFFEINRIFNLLQEHRELKTYFEVTSIF